MSNFEKFVTEGNETADELAKAGAMLDEGFKTEARAKTVQQEREVYAAIVKSSSRSQKKGGVLWTREERKRNIERNGELRPTCIDVRGVAGGSKYMKMQGKCTGPKYLTIFLDRN